MWVEKIIKRYAQKYLAYFIKSPIFPGGKKNDLQDGPTRRSRWQHPFGFGDIFRETGKKGYWNDIADESCGFKQEFDHINSKYSIYNLLLDWFNAASISWYG